MPAPPKTPERTPASTGFSAALLLAVKDWAETHFDEVHAARERYDTEG
ncbi:hypothetical protein [Streptomyces bobili]